MNTFLRSLIPASIGGLVVAGVFLATGVGTTTETRTYVQRAPISASPARDGSDAPTARDIYKRDAPGVVNIRSEIVTQSDSPFGLPQQQEQGEATGSGFVLNKAGFILTNAHVVDGASKVTVTFEDHQTVDAKVAGKDASSDLALLKVETDGLDLAPLQLGDSSGVQVGDPTIAIGNPFGLDRTLTTGVVSALQREIKAPDGFAIRNVIQTDAAINPGNSGGPLLDAGGRVIGINSQIATGGSGNGSVGIGFAVPINTAKTIIPQLQKDGRVSRAYIGITGRTIDASLARLNLKDDTGVLIQSVEAGSPAKQAGLRAGDTQVQIGDEPVRLGGDVIVVIDGKSITSMDQVAELVASRKPGATVKVTVERDGRKRTIDIKLAQRPATAQTLTQP